MYALLALLMGKSSGTGPGGGRQWARPELYYTVRLPGPQSVPFQSYHNHVKENTRYTVALYLHTMLLFYILVFVPLCWSSEEKEIKCNESLGMESGRISDAQLSASSSYEINSVGPLQARLNNNKGGGAWCPKSFISENSLEFLEIDLGEEYLLQGVVTQGRFANGLGQEFAEYYRIQYWRKGMPDFEDYRDSEGVDLFKGNRDTYTEVELVLNPAFQASRLRVIPFSHHPRTICMRVELKGCKAEPGIY